MAFVDRLNEWKEGNRLEFKLARGGFPKSFWETYSAFANTEGGLIVLGVEESSEGNPRIVGVPNADSLVQDLWNGLNNQQKVSANLLVESDVIVEGSSSALIVAVKVPRADRSQRPVYINNSMNTGTYRRNGEGDYRCTMEAISAMVRDNAEGTLDKESLPEIGLDALNGDSIRSYRSEFAAVRAGHPWGSLSEEEFLLRLGAIGRAREDGMLHPTKAGLLMFGESWRITDAFPNYFLDCRQVSEGRRWDNRITSDSGDWSGNVYDFWNRAILMLCEGLPRPFSLGLGLTRVDDTPQHEAIREGLTNALVHADYHGRTGVVAVRRKDSVEFSNPGCLRLPAEVVTGGGVSDPRNKTLMTMFNLVGKGDKAGSGFDVFRRAAEYSGVGGPLLEELLEPDRTKLLLRVELDGSKLADAASHVDGEDGEHVGNVGNPAAADVGNVGNPAAADACDTAMSSEVAAMRCLRADPKASAASIASLTGFSTRQIERALSRLRESGSIVRIGGTRGHWEIKR